MVSRNAYFLIVSRTEEEVKAGGKGRRRGGGNRANGERLGCKSESQLTSDADPLSLAVGAGWAYT